MNSWQVHMSDQFSESLVALVKSEHAALYAYGVIAGNVHKLQKKQAIGALAIHRAIRTELISLADSLSLEIPLPSDSYELPVPVTNQHSAVVAATEIEHELCALWATAMSYAPEQYQSAWALNAQACAQRAFGWSRINPSLIG